MKIRATFRPRRRDDAVVDLPAGATAMDLLDAVGEAVDVTVVVRAGVPIPEDEPLADGDDVMLLSAASGG